jgi:hypothetical protein
MILAYCIYIYVYMYIRYCFLKQYLTLLYLDLFFGFYNILFPKNTCNFVMSRLVFGFQTVSYTLHTLFYNMFVISLLFILLYTTGQ